MAFLQTLFFKIEFNVLEEQSRPSVSNLKSADVRLARGISTATSLDNVTNSV